MKETMLIVFISKLIGIELWHEEINVEQIGLVPDEAKFCKHVKKLNRLVLNFYQIFFVYQYFIKNRFEQKKLSCKGQEGKAKVQIAGILVNSLFYLKKNPFYQNFKLLNIFQSILELIIFNGFCIHISSLLQKNLKKRLILI